MKLTDDQKMALYQEQVDDHIRETGGEVLEEYQDDPYQELMANEYRIVDEQNRLENEKS